MLYLFLSPKSLFLLSFKSRKILGLLSGPVESIFLADLKKSVKPFLIDRFYVSSQASFNCSTMNIYLLNTVKEKISLNEKSFFKF